MVKSLPEAVPPPAHRMLTWDLFDAGALSVMDMKRLVVDASYIDQKKRGVLDMKDTMLPLARLLVRQEFRDRYGAEEKGIDLMLY
jgi:protein CMS1